MYAIGKLNRGVYVLNLLNMTLSLHRQFLSAFRVGRLELREKTGRAEEITGYQLVRSTTVFV